MVKGNLKKPDDVSGRSGPEEAGRPPSHGIHEENPPAGDGRERHFATAHLLLNLRQRTISSGVVTIAAQGTMFVLNLGSIMILARILAPQDFGLVAMVAAVMSFLRVFKDAGLTTATIQRDNITHAQVSNLFWINLGMSALLTLIVAVSAPGVAWLYREPELTAITLVLSFSFLFEGSAAQHLALFNRQMRFKLLAFIQIISAVVAILVAIAMARLGCRYWSLVALQLTPPMLVLFLTLANSHWRPQRPTRGSGTRSLVSFGAKFAASGFLWSLARATDGFLVGKFFGSASLGLYSRASVLLHRPLEQLLGPVNTVLVPVFSRIQSDPQRYRRTVLQVYEAVALVSFFFTALFLALARPITLVVLGSKWSDAVPIFAGFAIGAIFLPLGSASTWLFASQGRGRDSLIATSIASGLAIVSMVAGLPFGPAGVAYSYSISGLLILLPVMYYFTGRRGPVSTRDLWVATLRHAPIWGIVCGATYGSLTLLTGFGSLTQLAICVPTGLLAGALFVSAYPPSRRVALHLLSVLKIF